MRINSRGINALTLFEDHLPPTPSNSSNKKCFPFCVFQDQLASLLKTAEDLRIKGLAEVSWRDDDEPPTRRRTSSMISTTPNNNFISNIPKKRNSISCNNNNSNSTNDQINSTSTVDTNYIPSLPTLLPHLAASPSIAAAVAAATSSTSSTKSTPLSQSNENDTRQIRTPQLPHLPPLMDRSPQHKSHSDGDENLPPIKKKRGRPPLDNDFDSYSTPKFGHGEYSIGIDHHHQLTVTPAAILNDDNSGDHSSRPHSMLEQSLEVQMDCEDDLPMHHIVPKTERPDTPPSVKNYAFDESYYNPPSPMEDPCSSANVSRFKQ